MTSHNDDEFLARMDELLAQGGSQESVRVFCANIDHTQAKHKLVDAITTYEAQSNTVHLEQLHDAVVFASRTLSRYEYVRAVMLPKLASSESEDGRPNFNSLNDELSQRKPIYDEIREMARVAFDKYLARQPSGTDWRD